MEKILAKAVLANHIEETRFNRKRCIHCLTNMANNGGISHKYSCPVNTSVRLLRKKYSKEAYFVDAGDR